MKLHHIIIIFLQVLTLAAVLGLNGELSSKVSEVHDQVRVTNMYLRGSVLAAPTPTPEPICQPTPPLVLR